MRLNCRCCSSLWLYYSRRWCQACGTVIWRSWLPLIHTPILREPASVQHRQPHHDRRSSLDFVLTWIFTRITAVEQQILEQITRVAMAFSGLKDLLGICTLVTLVRVGQSHYFNLPSFQVSWQDP